MPGNPYWNRILALEPEISQNELNEIENMPNVFLDQFHFYYTNLHNFRRAVVRATEESFEIFYEIIHRIHVIDSDDEKYHNSQQKLNAIIGLLAQGQLTELDF